MNGENRLLVIDEHVEDFMKITHGFKGIFETALCE